MFHSFAGAFFLLRRLGHAKRSPSSLVLLLRKHLELAYPELKAYMLSLVESLRLKPTKCPQTIRA